MQHGDVLNELPVSNGSQIYIGTINYNNDHFVSCIRPVDDRRY